MRDIVLSDWLSESDWAGWVRTPVTGDASARRYERLTNPIGQSVIVMDAPPDVCGSQKSFVEIAKHLTKIGLVAPEILTWDDPLGLIVMSDLGTVDFANHLMARPTDEKQLYECAVDVLRALHSAEPPSGLTHMTPAIGTEMADVAFDWAAIDNSTDLRIEIKTQLQSKLTQVDLSPSVLSLRDFHAENLIWRGSGTKTDRVGLLDFQDAFVTHATYDLASLLRDARRNVAPNMLESLLHRLNPTADQTEQRIAFHIMAVQRNLRILGVFRRLAERDGKTQYLELVPRVENHLHNDLATPELGNLGKLIKRAFFSENTL